MPPASLLERAKSDTFRPLFGLSDRPGFLPHPRAAMQITAAVDEPGGRWHGVVIVEGVRTTDHREVANGALGWRDLPLPFMFLPENSWGHDRAKLAGRIETGDRLNNQLMATGIFDDGEAGQEAQRMLDKGFLRWVSADLEVTKSTLIEVGINLEDELGMLLELAEDGSWNQQMQNDGYDWWERVDEGNVMGVTQVPFPAFPQAVIAMEGQELPEVSPTNGLPTLTSSGTWVDGLPPAEWFTDPQLPGPTKFRIDDDGRISGHVAAWGTDHIGLPAGTKPPRSRSGYAYFRMGTTKAMGTDGPVEVQTGPVTIGGGHADRYLGWRGAAEHYDNSCSALADVACGEDEHGIWVAGAVRPGSDESLVRAARGARGLSGDWRPIGGTLELVAALVVNVPGFPIPLAAGGDVLTFPTETGPAIGVVDGEVVSLVAAGIVKEDPVGAALRQVIQRLGEHDAILRELGPLARDKIMQRLQRAG